MRIRFAYLHRKSVAGIVTKALAGLCAACLACALLGSPSARAGTSSATASVAFPLTYGCFSLGTVVGGSGFTSASTGPISCAGSSPSSGATYSGVASASGSWVTGDFSASAVVGGNPVGGFISASATNTFYVAGLVTLPPAMTSAAVTAGVTGLSGVVGGGPMPSSLTGEGGFGSDVVMTLKMAAGGSGGTSGSSEACLALPFGFCPDGTPALAVFGPGALAPITLTVHNGDYLQLSVTVQAQASANGIVAPEAANAGIAVDPLHLTLPPGATFDSGVPEFLSGPVPSVPEPGSSFLFAAGLLGLFVLRRRLA